nr:MAG TPA: hypothetical protein [Caudoviricetes sp.]
MTANGRPLSLEGGFAVSKNRKGGVVLWLC